MEHRSLKEDLIFFFIVLGALMCIPFYCAYSADLPSVIDQGTAAIHSWQSYTVMLAVVAEAVFRLLPTKTPLSIAWIISSVCHSLANFFEAAAKWLDSWLPQNKK